LKKGGLWHKGQLTRRGERIPFQKYSSYRKEGGKETFLKKRGNRFLQKKGEPIFFQRGLRIEFRSRQPKTHTFFIISTCIFPNQPQPITVKKRRRERSLGLEKKKKGDRRLEQIQDHQQDSKR